MTQHRYAQYLLAITLCHFMFGIVFFYPYFWQMMLNGWVFSAGANFIEGAAATWFMLFTWPLFILIANMWQQQTPVKGVVLWLGIFGSILGISIMPDSGFWLLLILNGYALTQTKKALTE